MSGDKIKIIEYGMDDDRPARPGRSGPGAIKIKTFDEDPADATKHSATAARVGHIKIIEFDDDRRSPAPAGPSPAKAERRVGPVKIKEFDEDRDPEGQAGGSGSIKIMEFD